MNVDNFSGQAYPHAKEAIYQDLLFHGPLLQGLEKIESCSGDGIVGISQSTQKISDWMVEPIRKRWVTDPLVLDGSFQMMILWSIEKFGSPSLPCYAGSYRQYSRTFPKTSVLIVAQICSATSQKAIANIDFIDENGTLVAQIKNYECIIDASLSRAFQDRQLPMNDPV